MPAVLRAMVLAGVVAVAMSGSAHAGRGDYGWLYSTEVLPERSVELQQWVWEEDNKDGPAHTKETKLWWGPVVGLTDQLEIALPIELAWSTGQDATGATTTRFTLSDYGIEARYRFVSQDPVDKPAFAPLLRVGVKRDVTQRDGVIGEADLVAAYDFSPDVQAAVDVGFIGEVHTGNHPHDFELRPAVGVSVKVVGDVRFGAEAFAALDLLDSRYSWAVVGPNMAVTHGRFWLSAAFGIGVYHIDYAPRLIWGVLF